MVGSNEPTVVAKQPTRCGPAKNLRVSIELNCRKRSCREKFLERYKWIERSSRAGDYDFGEWSRYYAGIVRGTISFEGGGESQHIELVLAVRSIRMIPNMSAYCGKWSRSVLRRIFL